MRINLTKGERVNLSKEAPDLNKILIGLGWDTNRSDTGEDFDLDASVFLLGAEGRTISQKDFVFYNNLKSPDGSVEHTGDNLTGAGDGDDEQILVNLSKVSAEVHEIIFTVTIYEAEKRKQNFGQISNAIIRLVNQEAHTEVLRYELDEDYSRERAIEFGRLYRKENTWRFQAVGTGYNNGLQGFVDKYIGV